MQLRIFDTSREMSQAAAAHAAEALRRVIAARGHARLVAATAASQIEFQHALVRLPGIDWSKVELFQLDEYIGLPADHPALFRCLLHEHLIAPTGIGRVHLIDGVDAENSILRMNAAISAAPVDIAFLGIGENAHLAFNDPPADFETTTPYLAVQLDEACRQQQVGERWFQQLRDVPARAVTISIQQILSATELLVIVPDARKAPAVHATLEAPVSSDVPASILRRHANVTLFLDRASAGTGRVSGTLGVAELRRD